MDFPVGFSRSREKKGKKDEQFSMTLLNIYNNFRQKEIVCNTSDAKNIVQIIEMYPHIIVQNIQ
jgi:hypothetical protein